MTRIVHDNYPVAGLPEDLREGLAVDTSAQVMIVPNKVGRAPGGGFSLQTLYSMGKPSFRDRNEIIDHITTVRHDWVGR